MSVSFERRVASQSFGHCPTESDFLRCKEWPRILEERGSKELQLYMFFFSVVIPVLVCNHYTCILCVQKFNVWSIIEAHKYCRVGVESIDVEFPNCVEVWGSLGSCNGDLA